MNSAFINVEVNNLLISIDDWPRFWPRGKNVDKRTFWYKIQGVPYYGPQKLKITVYPFEV